MPALRRSTRAAAPPPAKPAAGSKRRRAASPQREHNGDADAPAVSPPTPGGGDASPPAEGDAFDAPTRAAVNALLASLPDASALASPNPTVAAAARGALTALYRTLLATAPGGPPRGALGALHAGPGFDVEQVRERRERVLEGTSSGEGRRRMRGAVGGQTQSDPHARALASAAGSSKRKKKKNDPPHHTHPPHTRSGSSWTPPWPPCLGARAAPWWERLTWRRC